MHLPSLDETLACQLHPGLPAACHWIARQSQPAIDRLVRWCDQGSWSRDADALRGMARTLVSDFADDGINLQTVTLPQLRLLGDCDDWVRCETGPALVWHHNEHLPTHQRVLLMIHYDTVYPPHQDQSACRLQTSADRRQSPEASRLIGPGVADAKGGIAVIALATAAMRKFQLLGDVGLSILLNPDEEIGSSASAGLMRAFCDQFHCAFLFEPTLPDESLVSQRKGSGDFLISVHGRSAHAGRDPASGRNAIVKLAQLIGQLQGHFDLDGKVSINVASISGGGPLNRVPDHALAKMNVRVTDHASQQAAESLLRQIAGQASVDGFRVNTLGEFHCPPKQTGAPLERLQNVVENASQIAGLGPVTWNDTGGACDGCQLAAWGLPNVDTMGVRGGNLHSPDEFMFPASLVPAAIRTVLSVLLAVKS